MVCLFIGMLFVSLLVCWFDGLLVCRLVGLLACWFVGSLFVCSFVRASVSLLVRSFV